MKTGHINDWAPEVRSLLKRLVAAGATIVSGDNGEDRFDYPSADTLTPGTEAEFIENLIACDEAHLYVHTPHCPAGRNRWLYLVLGNSPGEVVSDHIVDELIDAVTRAHYDEWEGKPQPTKPNPYRQEGRPLAEDPNKYEPINVGPAPLKLSGNMVTLPIVDGSVPDSITFDPETGAA